MTTLWPDAPAGGGQADEWPDAPAQAPQSQLDADPDSYLGHGGWKMPTRAEAQQSLNRTADEAWAQSSFAKAPTTANEAFWDSYADIPALGNLPRLRAGIAAGREALRGGDPLVEYRAALAVSRERLRRAREEHPGAALGGTAVGGVVTSMLAPYRYAAGLKWLPGIGPWAARAAAGRGIGSVAAQAGIGAASGALFGGLYGASAARPDEAVEGAREAAAGGAVLGGAFPVVARSFTSRPLWQRLLGGMTIGGAGGAAGGALLNQDDPVGGARAGALLGAGGVGGLAAVGRPLAVGAGSWLGARAREAGAYVSDAIRQGAARMGSQTNALIGGVPFSGGGQWPPRRETTNVVSRLLNRGVTPRHLEERAALAEATGRNPLAAQVLGEAGLQRAQTLSGMPGRTPQLAADVVGERRQGQLQRLVSALDEASGTDQSGLQAGQALEREFENISAQHYEPILNRAQIGGQNRARLEDLLSNRLPPEIVDATTQSMERVARMRGQPALQPGDARYYHNFYRALGQTIRNLERNPNAIERRLFGPDDVSAMRFVRNEMRDALDTAIPGYREARHAWAGLSDAEDAMDWGGGLLVKGRMSAEEVADEFGRMTPFEQDFARVGLRDQMRLQMAERSREGVRKRNISELFSDEETRNKIRAVFGERAERLMRQFEAEDLEFNELGSILPRANSKTAPMIADMVDQMSMQQGAGSSIPSALGRLYGEAVSPLFEAQRNRVGRALFSELSPAQIRDMRRMLRARLSRDEWRRLRRYKEAGEQGMFGTLGPLDETGQQLDDR